MDGEIPVFVVRDTSNRLTSGRFATFGRKIAILQTRDGATELPKMTSERDRAVARIVLVRTTCDVRTKAGRAEYDAWEPRARAVARTLNKMPLAVAAAEAEGPDGLDELVTRLWDETA